MGTVFFHILCTRDCSGTGARASTPTDSAPDRRGAASSRIGPPSTSAMPESPRAPLPWPPSHVATEATMLDVSPGLQRMRNHSFGATSPGNRAPALSWLAASAWETKVGRSGPVPADRLQRAPCAPTSVLPGSAGPADAEVAARDVVAYGIRRIQRPEPAGHLFRRLPGQVLAPGEADEPADPAHVRAEGNHQLRHRHPAPEPEVGPVRSPHHPAEEQVEALAGAAALRVRQQVFEPPGRGALPGDGGEVWRAQLVDEGAQRGADRPQPPVVRGEAGAERPVRAEDGGGVRRGKQRLQRRPEQLRARPRPHRPSSSSKCPSSGRMRRSQASRTAAGLPGRAKTIRPSRVTPATARESMAALPISWKESMRNSSPNPGSGRAMAALTASKVLSREVMPVPPVISTTWAEASRARSSSCE